MTTDQPDTLATVGRDLASMLLVAVDAGLVTDVERDALLGAARQRYVELTEESKS